jgi:hypothetical protein
MERTLMAKLNNNQLIENKMLNNSNSSPAISNCNLLHGIQESEFRFAGTAERLTAGGVFEASLF